MCCKHHRGREIAGSDSPSRKREKTHGETRGCQCLHLKGLAGNRYCSCCKARRYSTILDACDTEVQSESVRSFEGGLLFPIDVGTSKANVFPTLMLSHVMPQFKAALVTKPRQVRTRSILCMIPTTRAWIMISHRRITCMTHPADQREGGLGQDQTLTHDHIALETSNASVTFVYTQCNLIMLASLLLTL